MCLVYTCNDHIFCQEVSYKGVNVGTFCCAHTHSTGWLINSFKKENRVVESICILNWTHLRQLKLLIQQQFSEPAITEKKTYNEYLLDRSIDQRLFKQENTLKVYTEWTCFLKPQQLFFKKMTCSEMLKHFLLSPNWKKNNCRSNNKVCSLTG